MTRAFNRIHAAAATSDSVEYNGKTMSAEHAAALKALLDDFAFIVQADGDHPNIVPTTEFSKLPFSTTRPQLNPRAGHARFYAGVT